MDFQYTLSRMEENAGGVRALVASRSDQEPRWKPDPVTWSVLEGVNHLLDEEREDFCARVDLILRRYADVW